MKTATTREERMALIKEIAKRKRKLARVKATSITVIRKAEASLKPARSFMDTPDDSNKNPNYYTDASKYAAEYYGDTFRETTKFDSPFANGDWE